MRKSANRGRLKMTLNDIKSQRPGFIAGVTVSALIAGSLFLLSRPAPPEKNLSATVKPGTGATAEAGKVERKKDTIEIPIIYNDAGSSTVVLPVDSIPEAYAWRRNVWSTSFLYLGDGTISVMKGYRFGRVSFAAGPWVRIPRLDSPLHFRRDGEIDAGVCFAFTVWSDSFLF